MNKVFLVKPVPEDHEQQFINLISKNFDLDHHLLSSLKDYFKEDFYLILSLFEGKEIKFPTVNDLNLVKVKIGIFEDYNKLNKPFEEAIEILSDKYHLTTNQVYMYYREMKDGSK